MAVKRVVIIGATSGIGLEVAKGYLKAGWQVGILRFAARLAVNQPRKQI